MSKNIKVQVKREMMPTDIFAETWILFVNKDQPLTTKTILTKQEQLKLIKPQNYEGENIKEYVNDIGYLCQDLRKSGG